jgi:hypothetical protein
MIVHITPGDKFGRYAAEQFETVLPGRNRFVTVLPESGCEVDGSGGFDSERVVVGTDDYARLLDDVSRSECVVFHSLNRRFVPILERCPPSCVTAWVLWGFEVYGLTRHFPQTLQPLTARFQLDAPVRRRLALRMLRRVLGPFFPRGMLVRLANLRRRLRQRRYAAALRRFDYLLTYIDEEAELIRSHGISEARYLPFCYYSLTATVGKCFMDMRVSGRDILLGNSASFTSNHLDAFELLAKLDLTGRRVVCPLSYGDADYAKAVAEAGRDRLGDTFMPLHDFMPIDEYNRLMESCGVVVMNHLRQQAMGNIMTALWLGAKVYLNETTTVWRYLRRSGIKAYSIPAELRPGNREALEPPPEETVERNREVLKRKFSYDKVLGYCRGVVEELERRTRQRGRAGGDPS